MFDKLIHQVQSQLIISLYQYYHYFISLYITYDSITSQKDKKERKKIRQRINQSKYY